MASREAARARERPPSRRRSASALAPSLPARTSSCTASALTRSVFPRKKARKLNSPGRAGAKPGLLEKGQGPPDHGGRAVAVELDAVLADGPGGRSEDGREDLVHRLSALRIDEFAVDERQTPSGNESRGPRKERGGQLHGAGAGRCG